jgi:phosphoglycerate dehydrogenase-like enzyme
VDPRLDVVYEPELLAPPRYAADHTGAPFTRTPEQEARWRGHLARADVLFDFDRGNADELHELAPNVRWIQATSAGIGQYVAKKRFAERMPDTVFTTASGAHVAPLAEFCALGMLAFSRGLFEMQGLQRERRWERFAATDLVGRTVVIYGLGAIGSEVARLSSAMGMNAIGIKRSVDGLTPADLHVRELHPSEALHDVLPRAEFLVLVAPHTPETEHAIGRDELALLPAGAVVINIGRGALIDDPALVEALRTGHLGGAALDVFEKEPLPDDSPLWEMPNVLVSPHSASTSDRENARITDLFVDNLRRWLKGEELLNVLDATRMY